MIACCESAAKSPGRNRRVTYVLLCGYSPCRSDDMKELVRQTTKDKIDWYWNNVSGEGETFSIFHPCSN
jgi:calcium/calmodulin-dependent protein kinase I